MPTGTVADAARVHDPHPAHDRPLLHRDWSAPGPLRDPHPLQLTVKAL